MGNAALARPARFDASTKKRRSLIAKIQVARSQLGMVEDDYRSLLFDTTGKMSLKGCSDGQLVDMVEALKGKGFKPLPTGGNKGVATHPMALKARALWISLYQLGVVHHPGEPALETFAKRQLKCERLVWARQSHSAPLIEALKGMAIRHGWKQTDHRSRDLGPIGLKESLCKAIVQRLKDADAIPADWSLDIAAYRLCGVVTANDAPFTAQQYQDLAAGLGEHLRPALARKQGEKQ